MGAWDTGLWSADTAVDVRAADRETLERRFDDAAATAQVLAGVVAEISRMQEPPLRPVLGGDAYMAIDAAYRERTN
jgi:hypothetical protein